MVTVIKRRDLVSPTYKYGFARNAAESVAPQDWDGLIALWIPSLGPPGGSTLRDLSGYGHHGAFVADTSWALDAEAGYIVDLDGAGDFIDVVNSAPLRKVQETNAMTVCAWVKHDAGTLTSDRRIVTRWDNNSGSGLEQFILWMDTGGAGDGYAFVISTGSNVIAGTDTTNALTGVWQWVVGTWDGITVRVYTDGVETASTASAGAINDTQRHVEIGAVGGASSVAGLMEDIRIYDRALSPSHILEMYHDHLRIVRRKRRFHGVSEQGVAVENPDARSFFGRILVY